MDEEEWEVLTDEEAAEVAMFGGITMNTVRAIELVVLLKAKKVVVDGMSTEEAICVARAAFASKTRTNEQETA